MQQEWLQYSSTVAADGFNNVIPMIDVSAKMQEYNSESFYSGVGLALLVAQRSHNRIIAYGDQAEWIVLSDPTDFMKCIQDIKQSISSIENMGSSFHSAVHWFYTQYMSANENLSEFIVRKQLRKTKLVVFSNLFPNENEAADSIVFGIDGPKIIYWNLATSFSTFDSPCLYNQVGRVLFSGLSGSLLSIFSIIKQYEKNSRFCPYSIIGALLLQPCFGGSPFLDNSLVSSFNSSNMDVAI
jgi:hypothetical protein